MDQQVLSVPAYLTTMLNIAFIGYFVCGIAYGVLTIARRPAPWALRIALYAISAMHLASLLIRWYVTGRPPFISLYEMVIFIAWAMPLVYILLELYAGYVLVGMMTCIFAALALAYSNILDQTIEPLVPALQSNWLTVHIFAYLVGYAAAFVAFVMAVCYLSQRGTGHRMAAAFLLSFLLSGILVGYDLHSGQVPGSLSSASLIGLSLLGAVLLMTPLAWLFGHVVTTFPNAMPAQTQLLNRVMGFAFPFLTIGLVTGAVWAEQAWGVYWSWDNKENWSLITWGVFAAYLHSIYVMGWRRVWAVYLVVIAFLCIMITWLGVNYLPFLSDPLHSYASPAGQATGTHWGVGLYVIVSSLGALLTIAWAALRGRGAARPAYEAGDA